MVLYVIFGVGIGLLSALSLLCRQNGAGAAARLESRSRVAAGRDRQSLSADGHASLADAQQQEFSGAGYV